jgi:cation diffusion facilitator family transporter
MEWPGSDAEIAGRRLALFSVIAGAALALIKIAVGIAANSAAVVSDGFEAAADVISSAIVFAGLWLASKPPDDNHPYGHGRYETLAGLGVSAILAITGVVICLHSFASMSIRSDVKSFAIYPLLAAIGLKATLASLKFRTARQISSAALAADAWHDLTDLLSTCVALVAVSLALSNPVRFHTADHVGGIILVVIVIALGIRVGLHTVEQLVDTMPDEKLMNQIRTVAMNVPGAIGIEKCFARRTGLKYHVDLHLEVDPELTVRDSHRIAKQVKFNIKEQLDWVADVLVHVEPAPSAHVDAWQAQAAPTFRRKT